MRLCSRLVSSIKSSPMRPVLNPIVILVLLLTLACRAEPKGASGDPNGALAALVVTSDFESGAYSTVNPRTLAVHADIAAVHPDAVCRVDRTIRRPFIIERYGADAVDLLSPDETCPPSPA